LHEIADPIACIDCPLQDCPGLRPLEEHQLAFMQGFKEGEVALARGELLISEGQSHQQLYTLLGGVLIRWRSLDDGRRQIVNFMFPGDLVGLQSAFDEPAAHAVEALVDARLCRFPRGRFTELIASHPGLGYDITWLAAQEETALEGHIVSLGQRSARERVAYLPMTATVWACRLRRSRSPTCWACRWCTPIAPCDSCCARGWSNGNRAKFAFPISITPPNLRSTTVVPRVRDPSSNWKQGVSTPR